MSRTAARFTQADVARAIRAAKQTGAGDVTVAPDGSIVIRLAPPRLIPRRGENHSCADLGYRSVMDPMPRPRPPHLHKETSRHGKTVWVVRIGRGARTRLRQPYGTPAFDAEYKAALDGAPSAAARTPSVASLQWLWDAYRETGAWTALAASTMRQRENIMLHVLKESGAKPYSAIRDTHIQAGIERRSKTPAAARNFLDTMKGLFRWAKKRQHVKTDPTIGAEPPKRKKGKGFPAWTREDAEFEESAPDDESGRGWSVQIAKTS